MYNIWSAELDKNHNPGRFTLMQHLNSSANDYQLTESLDGTIIFTSERDTSLGHQDIYQASHDSKSDHTIHKLGKEVNSEDSEMSGYISPDGSFLIVATAAEREGLIGNDDLFVSFHTENGWSGARKPRTGG